MSKKVIAGHEDRVPTSTDSFLLRFPVSLTSQVSGQVSHRRTRHLEEGDGGGGGVRVWKSEGWIMKR